MKSALNAVLGGCVLYSVLGIGVLMSAIRLTQVQKQLNAQEQKLNTLGKASLDFLIATTRKWDFQQTDLLNTSNALIWYYTNHPKP